MAGAVRYIVEQSASEILKIFLLDADTPQQQQRRQWTPEQAWLLIKQLAEQETVGCLLFFAKYFFPVFFSTPLFSPQTLFLRLSFYMNLLFASITYF